MSHAPEGGDFFGIGTARLRDIRYTEYCGRPNSRYTGLKELTSIYWRHQ
jgi:hypothetical protein